MQSQINAYSRGTFNTGISLQLLINRLVSDSQDTALRNKTTMVNEVSRDIQVVADENRITPMIDELLNTVVHNSRNSHIHISADRFRDIVTLNIQDRNNYNGYALAYSIMSMESQVIEAGGTLVILGKQEKVTTVSFSFPNCQETPKYYC